MTKTLQQAGVIRETRRHELARVHPLERRAPLGRLGHAVRPATESVSTGRFGRLGSKAPEPDTGTASGASVRPRPHEPYVREFRVA